jgi:hypothetical protein
MKTRKFADDGGTLDDTLPPDSGLAQALNQPGDDPEGLYKYIRQMTATKPAKPKVVTKEELAKSGLSLRDYMNKQQGLTRRKEKNPTLGEGTDAVAQARADTVDYGEVLQSRETGRTRGGPSYDSAGKPSNAGPDVIRNQPKQAKRMPGPFSEMAKGGSVSSRADGIAQRGKTRGRMC